MASDNSGGGLQLNSQYSSEQSQISNIVQDKQTQIIELQQKMYIAHLERQLLSQIITTYYKVKKDGISDKLAAHKNPQQRSPRTFEGAQYEPTSTITKVTGKPSKPASV